MRIHWYWPFSHAGDESRYIASTLSDSDHVTVEALSSRFGKELSGSTAYELVRDLPETNATSAPRIRALRAAQRASIYLRRALARHRLVASGRFDLSFQHHLNHYVDAFALKRLQSHAALVSLVHDVIPHEPRFPETFERWLLRRTYRSAGQLVVYHERLRDHLIEEFDVEPSRIHVVPHPLERVCTVPRTPQDVCQFLFFGTFRQNKGVDELLSAIELLDMATSWRLHLAGRAEDALASRVRASVERFENVTCEFGFIDSERKRELFESADAVVLPYTRFASQSGVLADAYGYARPVIVSDVGALGATVLADETGLVVEPGNVESLAQAMITFIEHPELRLAWGRASGAAAEEHSFEAVGRRLRRVFDIAIERQTRGAPSGG